MKILILVLLSILFTSIVFASTFGLDFSFNLGSGGTTVSGPVTPVGHYLIIDGASHYILIDNASHKLRVDGAS